MTAFLRSVAQLLRAVAILVLVAGLAFLGWKGWDLVLSRAVLQEQLQKSQAELAAAQKRVSQLEVALKFLKVDHRLAEIVVLEQTPPGAKDHGQTRFEFAEVDDQGERFGTPKVFTIEGDLLYLDGRVIKFADQFVEAGDSLRGLSLFSFTRVFGAYQQPNEGFPLDVAGRPPQAYERGGASTDFEKEVWGKFWQYTADPELAAHDGVRAAHGEAVSTRLKSGVLYRVQLRASDGVSIVPVNPASSGTKS